MKSAPDCFAMLKFLFVSFITTIFMFGMFGLDSVMFGSKLGDFHINTNCLNFFS